MMKELEHQSEQQVCDSLSFHQLYSLAPGQGTIWPSSWPSPWVFVRTPNNNKKKSLWYLSDTDFC